MASHGDICKYNNYYYTCMTSHVPRPSPSSVCNAHARNLMQGRKTRIKLHMHTYHTQKGESLGMRLFMSTSYNKQYQESLVVAGVHSPPLCVCATCQENTPPPPHTASELDHLRENGREGETQCIEKYRHVHICGSIQNSCVYVPSTVVMLWLISSYSNGQLKLATLYYIKRRWSVFIPKLCMSVLCTYQVL